MYNAEYYDADGELYADDLISDVAKAAESEGMKASISGDRVYLTRDGRKMGWIELDGDQLSWNALKNKAGIRDSIMPHIA